MVHKSWFWFLFFQDKNGAEEESATLLSALTEMLDSVEDVDGTLSPFDTLPDTQLLAHPERRDNLVVGAHSGIRYTSLQKLSCKQLRVGDRPKS